MNSLDNEILKNYTNLKNKIEKYNNLYYNEDNPIISDMEYDGLLRKLKEMEKEYPALLEIDDSPTEKIGGTASNKFSKVEHKVPMLSLSNNYNIFYIFYIFYYLKYLIVHSAQDTCYYLSNIVKLII